MSRFIFPYQSMLVLPLLEELYSVKIRKGAKFSEHFYSHARNR